MPAGGWTKPGQLQTDQSGVPSGYKRCSQRTDPRCIARDGIFPEDHYRIIRPDAPTPRIAFCKFCDAFKRSKKALTLEHQDTYLEKKRRSMRNKRRRDEREEDMAKRVTVLYDPAGLYLQNVLFNYQDFMWSLEAGVWAEGMIVRADEICYEIRQMELVETPDRNWFEFRKEMLDA